LPFSISNTVSCSPFDLIHCDLWTYPILSFSGFKYYLVIIDDYSYYVWTFPLKHKSDTSSCLKKFITYTTFASSDAYVTPLSPPPQLTNLTLKLVLVFSSAMQRLTRVIGVLTWLLIK
ncbi:hypothetical protein V2J09_012497, partial [Rumex salicifolius]